jgi:acid phosphatase type 7
VRYGTNLAHLCFTNNDVAPAIDHTVTLTNLGANTKYFYSVGSLATPLAGEDANHYFITSPLPGTMKNTRIWVLGDAGTATADQVNVRDAYETFTGSRPTDLWLMLGDNAYESGLDSEYQLAVFNIYTNLLRQSVLWPALGNHDTAQATAFVDTYPYFDMFTLPKNGEAGGVASGTEHYYSFDHANIHFICLDSMTSARTTNSAMYLWLTNDLANVTADWTIAYWHHPPYTKGSHDSDYEVELIEMRQVFLPVLEQGGVDLVLAGHSHVYERSFLLDQHYGDTTTFNNTMKLDAGSGRVNDTGAYRKNLFNPRAHQGVVYTVLGCSGHATGGALNHPAMQISLNEVGSLVLDVNSNRLDAMFLRDTGTTNDTFTILKVNSTTALRILSTTKNALGHCTITWASVGGLRYRVSYRDGNPNGAFTELVRPAGVELDSAPSRSASTQSFTDDFTLCAGPPANGARYFRVRVVP